MIFIMPVLNAAHQLRAKHERQGAGLNLLGNRLPADAVTEVFKISSMNQFMVLKLRLYYSGKL